MHFFLFLTNLTVERLEAIISSTTPHADYHPSYADWEVSSLWWSEMIDV